MRAKFVSIEIASARGVDARWLSQYCRDGVWTNTAYGKGQEIHEKLCALGPNPPIDKVAEIIGNKSWSYITCDGCNDSVAKAVCIGSDYDQRRRYCVACIDEAAQIIKPTV